jgi:hypothetical protein
MRYANQKTALMVLIADIPFVLSMPTKQWRRALALRLQRSVEAKLGRCSRCMTVSALLFVGSWGMVAVLAIMRSPSVAAATVATLAAVLCTGLAVAHSLAYVLRRFGRFTAHAQGLPPMSIAIVVSANDSASGGERRRGCGCGR